MSSQKFVYSMSFAINVITNRCDEKNIWNKKPSNILFSHVLYSLQFWQNSEMRKNSSDLVWRSMSHQTLFKVKSSACSSVICFTCSLSRGATFWTMSMERARKLPRPMTETLGPLLSRLLPNYSTHDTKISNNNCPKNYRLFVIVSIAAVLGSVIKSRVPSA